MSINNKIEFPSRYRQDRDRDNLQKVKQFIIKKVQLLLIVIGAVIALGIIYYPMLHAWANAEPEVENLIAHAEPVVIEKVVEKMVLIQPVPTQAQIVAEIHRVFPDAPIMEAVARCEGVEHGKLSIDVINPTNGSNDTGVFQISELYHKEHYTKLGLRMDNYKDNIAFARVLYDESGLQPWSASRHCWSK